MFVNGYPYTDFHEMNLDWIIEEFKKVHQELVDAKLYVDNGKLYIDGKLADATYQASLAEVAKTAAQSAQALAENARDSAANSATEAAGSATAAAGSATQAAQTVANTLSQVSLLQSRVDNIIPSGTQTEGNTELIDIRVGEDGTIYKSAGDAVRGQVSDLKSDLTNDYVPLVHNNLFSQAELVQTGKYVSVTNGHIVYGNNATYDSYIIPVDGVSKYTFTKTYFALLLEDDKYTAVGELIPGATIIDSTGASYIAFSIDPSLNPPSTYIVSKGTKLVDTDTLPELEPLPSMQAVINRVGNLADGKTKFSSDSADSMSSGSSIVLPVETLTELKKKSKVVFEADISTFSKVDVGYTYGTTMDPNSLFSVFEITKSVVNYYQGYFSSGITETQNHGLTLNGNIQVILEQTDTASCFLTIISDGEEYQHEFSIFELVRSGRPFALSVGSTLTNCKLTWTCGDFDKKIWMFGDSYFSYAPNRWPYFLHRHGYDNNVLMNGFPGEGSAAMRQSFNFLLTFATPMFSAMCTGMNDGTDSDSAPSSTWVTKKDLFLQYCANNNITPILATIPSVPNINHEQKNAWVRNSGYRYIDFAKAVGATSSGVWFDGMLSTDNVHPTEKGARALFARVLLDFPEIMIED